MDRFFATEAKLLVSSKCLFLGRSKHWGGTMVMTVSRGKIPCSVVCEIPGRARFRSVRVMEQDLFEPARPGGSSTDWPSGRGPLRYQSVANSLVDLSCRQIETPVFLSIAGPVPIHAGCLLQRAIYWVQCLLISHDSNTESGHGQSEVIHIRYPGPRDAVEAPIPSAN